MPFILCIAFRSLLRPLFSVSCPLLSVMYFVLCHANCFQHHALCSLSYFSFFLMSIVLCIMPFFMSCPLFSVKPFVLFPVHCSLRHALCSLSCHFFSFMSIVLCVMLFLCHALCSLSCHFFSFMSIVLSIMPFLCHAHCSLLCLSFYFMSIFLCINPFYVMPIVFCHAFRSLSCPLFSASLTSSCGLLGEGSLFKAGNHCRFIIAPRPSSVTPCLFYSTACLNFVLCISIPRSPSVLVSQSLASRGRHPSL